MSRTTSQNVPPPLVHAQMAPRLCTIFVSQYSVKLHCYEADILANRYLDDSDELMFAVCGCLGES